MGKLSVSALLSGASVSEYNEDKIKLTAEKPVIEIGANFNVYTDDLLNRGAAVVVTRENPTSPKVVKTIRRRGASFTCSYE